MELFTIKKHGGYEVEDVRLFISVRNTTSRSMVVHIEPWGVQNLVESGEVYEFDMLGPNDETLEVEFGESEIKFYGWPDSTTTARTDRPPPRTN